jgi:signal transduction histidine kinase
MITALCLALLCGAMAWTTHSMLRMETEQNRMANNAVVQEMARLALWRMESIASALVITESARPPEHYRTFSTPDALLNNKTLSTDSVGDWVSFSPLLREPPGVLKLHFEMDADGTLRSPQVPVGNDLMVCQALHTPPAPVIAGNQASLAELSGFIDLDNGGAKLKEMRDKLRVPPTLTGNRALLWSVNASPPPPSTPAPSPPGDSAPLPSPSSAADKPQTRVAQPEAPAYAIQQRVMKPDEAQQQQLEFNSLEERARQEFVQSGVEKAASRRVSNYDNLSNQGTRKMAESSRAVSQPPSPKEAADSKKDWIGNALSKSAASPQSAQLPANPFLAPPAPAAIESPLLPEAAPVQEVATATTRAPASAAPAPVADAIPEITDFRPLWLGEALLLTRRVTTPERQWIQGAWLDWNKLRQELLAAVQDRFPGASVVRAPENVARDAHLLASLPVQLIPGSVTFPSPSFWSPLRVSLSIAWLCVILAVAAVALVLRGMMSLSERRASFVSSVTHELRTPLATFKLYSEMLADGMVKEEAKKQQYLETLTGEADRLGHLVENVLAYSRIERGKGPSAATSVRIANLVDRIEPRLHQRTIMAGMDFGVTAAPGTLDLLLRTDVGAAEQILCNLVDNACKYGRRDGSPGKVELVISRERRRICFAVRDYGPGIPRAEQNNIFLPFHKSACDAAHSAPGVGLGLALCRRLAIELRGTLEVDRTWKQGACFVLHLPI